MGRKLLPWLELLRGPHSGPIGWAHFRDPTPSQEELGLWVNSAGYIRNRGVDAVIANRKLGCYGAVLIARGRAWFDSGPTGRRQLPEGTLFWMFPEIEHSYAPETDEWLEYWVQFDGPLAERVQAAGHLEPEAPFSSVGSDEVVTTLFQQLKDAFVDERPPAELEAAALVLRLIARAGPSAAATEATKDPLVVRAFALVDQNAMKPDLSPEGIARKLKVPYSTLRRRVREASGESLKARLLRHRINRAKELLSVSTLAIEQIGYACGFGSASYFARAFRESEGVTPRDFRRSQGRP